MRSLLTPIEYTRLDRMVDVMFSTATDVEEETTPDEQPVYKSMAGQLSSNRQASQSAGGLGNQIAKIEKGTWHFTDAHELQTKREQIMAALGHRKSVSLVRKSRALFWNSKRNVRVACAMSKRYLGRHQAPYWYAYHPQWDMFLQEAETGFFVLGCMDLETAFAVPHAFMTKLLPLLNTTTSKSGSIYWHVHLVGQGSSFGISIPKSDPIKLDSYAISIG